MSKKAKASRVEQDLAELTADLKRVQADFVNYRRRQEEEQAQILDVAKKEVVSRILPLIDNLERALGHAPKELVNNAWAKGVQQVAKQAQATLADLGVEKIAAKGQPFDPTLHEAVGMEEGDGEREVVIEEMQTGYKIGNDVIRPSMVKVGSK